MSGTYLSLFSGIGGLDLAVEAFGFTCVGQVEWDKHCTAVLERHWPGVPRWGDVAGLDAASYAEVTGGRLESGAAPRARASGLSGDEGRARNQPDLGGAAGDRGPAGNAEFTSAHTLTEERGSRSPASESGGRADRPGRGEQRAIARSPGPDLIIGGYPCQPFSAAGKRGGSDDARHLWPEFARLVGELRPRWALLENVPGHLSLGAADVLADLAALGYDTTWTTVRASDVGAPHRRERWFCLAEDTTSDTRWEFDGERRAATDATPRGLRCGQPSGPTGLAESDGAAPTDAQGERSHGTEETRRRGTGPAGSGAGGFAWGPYRAAIERWERVMGPAPHPVDDKGRLAPSFVEWMMGFRAGWTDGMTRTQALKALGNAVVPQQAITALSILGAQMNQRSERDG